MRTKDAHDTGTSGVPTPATLQSMMTGILEGRAPKSRNFHKARKNSIAKGGIMVYRIISLSAKTTQTRESRYFEKLWL